MAVRVKSDSVRAAANQAEAEELLARIGRLQRQVTTIELEMNERLAAIKAEHEAAAQPIGRQIEEDFAALQAWAEMHRAELLCDQSKTASLATGEVSWRLSPPSVRVGKPEIVLEFLRKHGLERFIRTKSELDKQAVLAEPEVLTGIKGISLTQREEFVAKPYESQLEKVRPAKATTRQRKQ